MSVSIAFLDQYHMYKSSSTARHHHISRGSFNFCQTTSCVPTQCVSIRRTKVPDRPRLRERLRKESCAEESVPLPCDPSCTSCLDRIISDAPTVLLGSSNALTAKGPPQGDVVWVEHVLAPGRLSGAFSQRLRVSIIPAPCRVASLFFCACARAPLCVCV